MSELAKRIIDALQKSPDAVEELGDSDVRWNQSKCENIVDSVLANESVKVRATPNIPGFDGPLFDTYVGDAVYASFVSGVVVLRTGAHDAPNAVYIDYDVWTCLLAWHARVVAHLAAQANVKEDYVGVCPDCGFPRVMVKHERCGDTWQNGEKSKQQPGGEGGAE